MRTHNDQGREIPVLHCLALLAIEAKPQAICVFIRSEALSRIRIA